VGLTPAAEETGTQHPYVLQYNATDMAFLVERARRIHFEVLVEAKKLVFRPAAAARPEPTTLTWGRNLRSFNPTMNTLRQVSEVTVRSYDPRTKKEIKGRAGAGDEDTAMGGRQTGPQATERAFNRRNEEIRVVSPMATQEEADQLARAIYNDRALEFVTGNGSSIGLPTLRAGRFVTLDGLGRFSGPYYVARASHSINASGYLTTFSVKRNSI
jgi:phage protein D